jgi:hypothetical protein
MTGPSNNTLEQTGSARNRSIGWVAIMRPAGVAVLALAMPAVGCSPAVVSGPPRLNASQVTEVRVTELGPVTREPRRITDAPTVSSIARSGAFLRRDWWAASERNLVPLYRIEFFHEDAIEATYFLGTNSHPLRFPCYWLCSGWWLGVAQTGGSFDTTRYLGLPESYYLPLGRDLQIP